MVTEMFSLIYANDEPVNSVTSAWLQCWHFLEEYLICSQIIYQTWTGLPLSQVALADQEVSWPGWCLAWVTDGYVGDNELKAPRDCESCGWKSSEQSLAQMSS